MSVKSRAEKFLQKAVADGRFGDAAEIIGIKFSDVKGEDQFASSVIFLTVKTKRQDVIRNVDVLVKMQEENGFVREMRNTDSQFYNEAVMYEEILPTLNRKNIVQETFPECFYGYTTNGGKPLEDFIILQDLKSFGFRLSAGKLFLDYDHSILTVKQLGRFHGLSYAAKKRDYKRFIDEVSKLKETSYEMGKKDEINYNLSHFILRGVLPFLERNEHKEILERFVKRLEDPFTLIRELQIPEEPIAVLCHGDFCRNNMLYKYDGDEPIDVKFFDIATAKYCSPAIDLSFFIFLNVPSEIRQERWNDLLSAYRDGISDAVTGPEVPSLDGIKAEMKRKAVYGYLLCSFFIPMMVRSEKPAETGLMDEMQQFSKMSKEERDEIGRSMGGGRATEAVVAVVRDLILHECL